jgi:hypothetical protein
MRRLIARAAILGLAATVFAVSAVPSFGDESAG